MTRHFTLYARPTSTKKQVLRLAFGARAGHATVRNRAKRQAREAHRAHRHNLPEAREIVITTRGRKIDALGRRAIRDELTELFTRAAAPASRPRGSMASMR
ncbi:MAG: ribonuclease P protein component [Candidatus Methylomirabilis oxyfera]|nr:ribonuclease P protein component [Candidatus Methylomirabilis oxyfera]